MRELLYWYNEVGNPSLNVGFTEVENATLNVGFIEVGIPP